MTAPPRTVAERLYRTLLFALPKDMRQAYASDASQVFRDLYRHELRQRGMRGALGVWRRAVIQTVGGGMAERWAGLRRPGRGDKHRNRRPVRYGVDDLRRDVRYTLRSVTKAPAFFATVIAIVALGIGATTTIFSVVDGVLLRDLPYPDPDELVFFTEGNHTPPDYQEWREWITSFEQLTAVRSQTKDLTNEGQPTRVTTGSATPSLFSMFSVTPQLGRLLLPEDARGDATVAVLGYEFWQSRWSGDSSVIGRSLAIDDASVTVVGVVSPRFVPPALVTRSRIDIWLPLDVTTEDLQRRGFHVLSVVGRLRDGASIEAAQEEMRAWELWAKETYPDSHVYPNGRYRQIPLVPLHEATVGRIRTVLMMLFGAVGIMLLIACANVANLFLARGTDREHEIAVRAALGAGRTRIVGQLMTESILIAVTGGAAGAALAFVGVKAFAALQPGIIPQFEHVGIDVRVLGFAVAASVLTGVLFGTAPALYAAKTDLTHALKESTKSTAGRGRLRLKNALVVVEIAMALILLTGAGLLFNSFLRVAQVDPGFEPTGLLSVQLMLGPKYQQEPGLNMQFADQVLKRIRRIPAVEHASVGVSSPFAFGGRCCWRTWVKNVASTDSVLATIHPVAPEYLETLDVRVREGRTFQRADVASVQPVDWDAGPTGPTVTVLTAPAAERLFPSRTAVGQTVTIGRTTRQPATVLGVTDDVINWSLSRDHDADLYVPYKMYAAEYPFLDVIVRTNDQDVASPIRQAVWDLDPLMPVPEIAIMDERLSNSFADRRFLAALLMTFATIAVTLAAAGIYGAMLYAVIQRHREFGIRIALGARSGRLIGDVVTKGLVLTVVGIGLGLAGAYGLSRVLESMVFGITTTDVPTFGAVALLLSTVAMIACYVPARRAAATDPMETLRTE